jgi:hypothetical protein
MTLNRQHALLRYAAYFLAVVWLGLQINCAEPAQPSTLSTAETCTPRADATDTNIRQTVVELLDNCQPPAWPERASDCVGILGDEDRPITQFNERLVAWVANTIANESADMQALDAVIQTSAQNIRLFHNEDGTFLAMIPMFRCGSGASHYFKQVIVVIDKSRAVWSLGQFSYVPDELVTWDNNRWMLLTHQEPPQFSLVEREYTLQQIVFTSGAWEMRELSRLFASDSPPTLTRTATGVLQVQAELFSWGEAPCTLKPAYRDDALKYWIEQTMLITGDAVDFSESVRLIEFWRESSLTESGTAWDDFCIEGA